MAKRYGNIDFLRTIGAIGIVLMHVLANGNYGLNGFIFERLIPSFTDFVFLFMVISGFSMCCGYFDSVLSGNINLEDFYKRRFSKVLPFFALLCIIDFVVSPSVNSIYEIFANLTLCFGFLPNNNITVIGVGWFLGLTFVFYIIFPFYCTLLANKKRAWFSFVIAIIFNYLCQIRFNAGRGNIVYSSVFYIAGGLIYLYRDILEKISNKNSALIVALASFSIAAYYMFENKVFIILMICTLLVTFSLKNGGGRAPCCKFYKQFKFRNIPMPHGYIPNFGKAEFNCFIPFGVVKL